MEAMDWVASKSPLHLASKHGHLTLVELLVLHGVVIDSRDGSLRTPLHRWGQGGLFVIQFSYGFGHSIIQLGKCSHNDALCKCYSLNIDLNLLLLNFMAITLPYYQRRV